MDSHYNFDKLYETQTMLDEQFLINEKGFDLEELEPHEKKIIFKNYYLSIRRMIHRLHHCKFTQEHIEARLNNHEKKYTFLMAQAELLFIDRTLGIDSLVNNNDKAYEKVIDLLDMLGFVDNGTFFK